MSNMYDQNEDYLLVDSHPRILFHQEVPYRVAQKLPNYIVTLRAWPAHYDKTAPPVLIIRKAVTRFIPSICDEDESYDSVLNIGDEIHVKYFQSASRARPTAEDPVINQGGSECIDLQYHGVMLSASRASVLPKWSRLGFITRVEDDGRVFLTDIKTLSERPLPMSALEMMDGSMLKLGLQLCFEHVVLPRGTYLSASQDFVVHPKALQTYKPYFLTPILTEYFLPVRREEDGPVTNEVFSQYLLSAVAFFECLYRQDMLQSVNECNLEWNLSRPTDAQVIYKSPVAIETGSDNRNYKNSLFKSKAIAVLKRIDMATSEESSPVYVRIDQARYNKHETIIRFAVDATYLMKTWKLASLGDLKNAKYKFEPTDLLSHLRAFNAKLSEQPDYILNQSTKGTPQGRILSALMPSIVTKSGHIRKLPSARCRFEEDRRMVDGELTSAQKTAVRAAINGEELLFINGGCKMGKTTTMVYAIPGILDEAIEPQSYEKCLALVSPSQLTLPTLIKKIGKNQRYNELISHGNIRVLNLATSDNTEIGSFCGVIDMLLSFSMYNLSAEDKQILKNAKWSHQSKVLPQYHGNLEGPLATDSYDPKSTIKYNPAFGDEEDDEESTDGESEGPSENSSTQDSSTSPEAENVSEDLITSTELLTLQQAVAIIFNNYRPNFVIAASDMLISLLPSVGNYITNLAVDEAGRSTLFDVLTMVTESPNLKQLILIGDTSQYPSHRRIRTRDIPWCFANVMKNIHLNSPSLKMIELNKTFNMNAALASVMQPLFYPNREITSLLHQAPLEYDGFGTKEFPLMFLDIDGEDIRVFPTTRYNPAHSFITLKAIQRVQEADPTLRITVLCYYDGQKLDIVKALRDNKLDKIVDVSTIDGFYGRTSDVVIIVATRTLDERKHPRRYIRVVKRGRLYYQRIPAAMNEVEELGEDAAFYSFVFDEQRLLTAISRGEKAAFIVGSAELLRENENWKQLLKMILDNRNFVAEPELLPQFVKAPLRRKPKKRRAGNANGALNNQRKRPRITFNEGNDNEDERVLVVAPLSRERPNHIRRKRAN